MILKIIVLILYIRYNFDVFVIFLGKISSMFSINKHSVRFFIKKKKVKNENKIKNGDEDVK
jgi:hypothetical protein